MGDFFDFFLRQSLAQQGPNHYGGMASPDVVPWGGDSDPDPAALADKMAVDPGRPLAAGVKNHVYLRARNGDPNLARVGQLYVAAGAPTYLAWPDALTPVPNDNGKPYFQLDKVKPDAVGVSTDAFTFTPSSAGDSLCAWIFTRDHPVRPRALTSVVLLAEFLAETPGYAQRSVGFGVDADGTYRFAGTYEQRHTPAAMHFAVQTADCRGCYVALNPVAGGDQVKLRRTEVTSDNFGVALDVDLPAGYTTTLELVIETSGVTLQDTSRVRVGVLTWMDAGEGLSLIPLGGHEWRAMLPG